VSLTFLVHPMGGRQRTRDALARREGGAIALTANRWNRQVSLTGKRGKKEP